MTSDFLMGEWMAYRQGKSLDLDLGLSAVVGRSSLDMGFDVTSVCSFWEESSKVLRMSIFLRRYIYDRWLERLAS